MSKKILIYLGDHNEKKDMVERVLTDLHFPYQFLSDEDLAYTCGYLMELEGFDAKKKEGQFHFAQDLMLLKDVEDDEINAITALLKTFHTEMKRKAMLTKHNRHWFVCDLMQEIVREHQYFQNVEKIQQLLMESQNYIIEEYSVDSWKQYEQAFYDAYACISKESTIEDVENAYQKLIYAKHHLEKR